MAMAWLVKMFVDIISSWYSSLKCFNKAFAFMSVLLIGQSLVKYGITRVAITYIDDWLGGHVLVSAALNNTLDGISSVLVLVLTYISDKWTGRFNMVFYISVANVTGCWLFFISVKLSSLPIFIISVLLLINFAECEKIIATAFLGDQVRNQHDPDEVVVHAEFWSRFYKVVGTIALVVGVSRLVDIGQLGVVATTITVGLIVYLFGYRYYNHEPPTGSPLASVYRVLKAAYLNRHLDYPTNPIDFHQNDGFELQLAPYTKLNRWLDKAAIKQACPTISLEDKKRRGIVCSVQQVKDVKFLLNIFPMWITFLVHCIVSATGDSYYVLQAEQMQSTLVSYSLLFATQSLAASLSWGLSQICLQIVRNFFATARPRAWKVNMTVGMICAFLSCFVAFFVERHRLRSYKEQSPYKKETEINYPTIFWLVPQFFLLGLMNGLCSDAFLMFYESQVTGTMKSYGPPFNECVIGFGKFFSTFLMVASIRWFGKTLNDSHLDNYYLLVAILALFSLVPFYYVSSWPLYDGAIDHPFIPNKEIQLSASIRVYPSTTVDGHETV